MTPISFDQQDLVLLNALQEDLPLVPNPWETIGSGIGIPGDEFLARLKIMAETGIIIGISPILEQRKGTLVSTLIALRVPDEKIAGIASIVNEYPEVSHNFRRNHEYNLWFTLAAVSHNRIDEIVDEIISRTGVSPDDMLNLKTDRRYKIDVKFPLIRKSDED